MAKKTAKKATKKTAKKTTTKKKSRPQSKSKGSFWDKEKKALEDSKTGGGGRGNFWKPGADKVFIRVLLSEDEYGEPVTMLETMKHWQNKRPTNCEGDSCRLCDLEEEVSEKTWGLIRPARRFIANIIVRNHPDGGDKQVLADFPVSVGQQIRDLAEQLHEDDNINVYDSKKGRDFKITRTGSTWNTIKYQVLPVQRESAIGMDYDIVDLNKYVAPPSDEDVETFIGIATG